MKALVTGGAGFLGSTLVDRLLAEGHAVDVVDDLSGGLLGNLADARADRTAELRIHQVDVRSPEVVDVVARRRPDVAYHLAAVATGDPVADAQVTLVGALHVLEGVRQAGAGKVVFAAGSGIYGEPEPSARPLRESHPLVPATAHDAASRAVLDYLRLYRERHRVPFTAVAVASVYGPRQRPERGLVAAFARAVLQEQPVELPGTGTQTRDLVYVDDVVDALVRASAKGDGLVVNVGRGVPTPVRAVLNLIVDAAGIAAPVVTSVPRPAGDLDHEALDPGRARIHLGWSPWTSLEEGVAQTLRWWARHPTT